MEEKNVKDIRQVVIDSNMTKEEKIQHYLKEMDSPYCFQYKDILKHISFSNTQNTINKTFESYFKAIHPPNNMA